MTQRYGHATGDSTQELERAGVPHLWAGALTKYMALVAYNVRPVTPRGELLELDGMLEPCCQTPPPRNNPKLHRKQLFESAEAILGLFQLFNVEVPEYEVRIERNHRGELEGKIRLLIYYEIIE